MTEKKSWAAVNPATRECEIVGIDDADTLMEMLDGRYIIVPVSIDTARRIAFQKVDDVFAIAEIREETDGRSTTTETAG